MLRTRALINDHTVRIDARRPGIDEADCRAPGKQRRKLLLDLVRVPEIVGIDRSDIIALRLGNGPVARLGNTRVGLPNYPNPWIFVGVALNELGCRIAGAVVNDIISRLRWVCALTL